MLVGQSAQLSELSATADQDARQHYLRLRGETENLIDKLERWMTESYLFFIPSMTWRDLVALEVRVKERHTITGT